MARVRSPRVAIGWLTALGVAVVVLMVATVLRGDRAPISQLWLGLVVIGLAWATVARFRSPTPVVRDWFQYLRSFVVTPPIVAGGLWLAATGGSDGSIGLRVICGLVALGALVTLAVEVRDFRLWRAEVRQRR